MDKERIAEIITTHKQGCKDFKLFVSTNADGEIPFMCNSPDSGLIHVVIDENKVSCRKCPGRNEFEIDLTEIND